MVGKYSTLLNFSVHSLRPKKKCGSSALFFSSHLSSVSSPDRSPQAKDNLYKSRISVHTRREEFENGCFTLKTHQMFSVHTTLEEFENGGFTLKTRQMFSVYSTLEEFENGGFTLKTHQMFSVHTTLEEFENSSLLLRGTRSTVHNI